MKPHIIRVTWSNLLHTSHYSVQYAADNNKGRIAGIPKKRM